MNVGLFFPIVYTTLRSRAASQPRMEESEETWTAGSSEPYTLNKADRLSEQGLGYTLNMMYTLYYEMSDTDVPSVSFPEETDPEQAT